jgi:hypothetical protein
MQLSKYTNIFNQSLDQKIAFALGIFEFFNVAVLYSKNDKHGKVGSMVTSTHFKDPIFKALWIGMLMFLGTERLSFAFASDKGSCCNYQSPWFINFICHCAEVFMWYSMGCYKLNKDFIGLCKHAIMFKGRGDEATMNFVLLITLPLLTVYFFISGSGVLASCKKSGFV